MSKYIRTEKGIYEVVEDSNKEWGKQIVVKFPKNLNMKLADVKDQVINQSDNLAELCDGFYLDDKLLNRFNKYAVFEKKELKKFTELFISYKKGNIPVAAYGFIKTSKGLIYVAKMNEDGNLELL